MEIIGLNGVTNEQLNRDVLRGGKFVMYEYGISVVVMTYRRSSNIYFVSVGKSSIVKGLAFSAGSLVTGSHRGLHSPEQSSSSGSRWRSQGTWICRDRNLM
jgi:hypothetical protein